jgi:hypothetical protein
MTPPGAIIDGKQEACRDRENVAVDKKYSFASNV